MTPVRLALFGALGALAPDLLILYSKRFSMPELTFDPAMYVGATVLYVGLAAIVAAIFPYGSRRSAWSAFAVGVALPTVIAAVASTARPLDVIPRGGGTVPGTFVDLISLF